MKLKTRGVAIAGIHAPGGRGWMTQVARNLAAAGDGFTYGIQRVILERDPLYTGAFRRWYVGLACRSDHDLHLVAAIVNNQRMAQVRKAARTYDRLSQPLVRERGELRPATWNEALDRAAAGFRRNIDAHGPNSLGIFSCSKSTNEVNFLAQKIARVAFGTNNIDSCNRT